MLKQFKLTTAVASNMALCYQKLQAAQEFARAVVSDKDSPLLVKTDLTSVSASITSITERIDRRIPKSTWESFKEQVKENDSLRLEEINRLYYLLTPDKQHLLEEMAKAMSQGKEIKFVEE